MADETLDAILAEMRAGVCTGPADALAWASAKLYAYADRIEAAAKRTAGNAAALREALTAFVDYLTQKRIDEVWAKTTLPEPGLDRLVAKARAALSAPPEPPSNAAAMRDVVESLCEISPNDEVELSKLSKRLIADDIYGGGLVEKIVRDIAKARAALAAPARNCDVSRDTKETIERCLASLNVESSSASFDAGVCAAIGWMLAAPAKGSAVSKPLGRPATEKEVESRFSGVVWCKDCSTPCPLSHGDALAVCEHYSAPAEKGGAE